MTRARKIYKTYRVLGRSRFASLLLVVPTLLAF